MISLVVTVLHLNPTTPGTDTDCGLNVTISIQVGWVTSNIDKGLTIEITAESTYKLVG